MNERGTGDSLVLVGAATARPFSFARPALTRLSVDSTPSTPDRKGWPAAVRDAQALNAAGEVEKSSVSERT